MISSSDFWNASRPSVLTYCERVLELPEPLLPVLTAGSVVVIVLARSAASLVWKVYASAVLLAPPGPEPEEASVVVAVVYVHITSLSGRTTDEPPTDLVTVV